jgi:sulfide dehydrogenase cytochrome subunit
MKWAVTALFIFMGSALAGEISPLVVMCDGCHGTNGVSQRSDMPTIAGISEFVHADALLAYKADAQPGEQNEFRNCDTGSVPNGMCAATAAMTDAQVEVLASYYAAKPFVPAVQEFDPLLAEQGAKVHQQACERCHSDNGSNPEDDASILKGQQMGYMRQAFAEYASGTRQQPDKMKLKMDPLSADQIEALIHFYASPD